MLRKENINLVEEKKCSTPPLLYLKFHQDSEIGSDSPFWPKGTVTDLADLFVKFRNYSLMSNINYIGC